MSRTSVKRVPKRGIYEAEIIQSILDKEFLCHVGFVHDGYPVVIPTLYGRKDNMLYLHGSMASRMMKNLASGIDICITVTRVNGLVLARSAFNHSANYESVVIFGWATIVADPQEKIAGLRIVSEHIIPGRWEECRQPNSKELKGTMLLKVLTDEASAKVRSGGPIDEKADYDLNIWAGVLPMIRNFGAVEPDKEMNEELPVPGSVLQLLSGKDL